MMIGKVKYPCVYDKTSLWLNDMSTRNVCMKPCECEMNWMFDDMMVENWVENWVWWT